jgi:SAM-dependent methyltransferase
LAETNPIALPEREQIREYLLSFDLFENLGRPEEGEEYVRLHLERLIQTLRFLPALEKGAAVLELGASPYFMTALIKKYLGYTVTAANFFADYGAAPGDPAETRVTSARFGETHLFPFQPFNIERDPFPYADASFDLVLCCEILEHLVMDPSHTLREVHRVLKPGGYVFLSTPNVLSLEYLRRLLRGENIFGNYSGYGVYGRHNREYTPGELADLLRTHRFEPTVYVEDVYPHDWLHRWLTGSGRFPNRRDNLFAAGKAFGEAVERYPTWLYAHQWGRPKVGRAAVTMGDGDIFQLGAGWYECEEWPPCTRWSHREAVVFLQAPSKAHTSLTVRAFSGPRASSGKMVFPGGWSATFAMEAGGPWEFSVPLPAAVPADGKGLMEVRLVVDHPFVPGKDGQGDTRELGIAVERLWLR